MRQDFTLIRLLEHFLNKPLKAVKKSIWHCQNSLIPESHFLLTRNKRISFTELLFFIACLDYILDVCVVDFIFL